MDQSNKISFKGEALARKRKKLRLSQAMVANKLTLSIDQINAIEKNQDRGFINFHFKALSIKRYARLLEVDLKKIIITKDDSTKAPAKNTPVSPRPFFKPFFTLIFLVVLLGVMMRIFIFDAPENIEDDLSITALEKSIIAKMKPMEN
ncbi:MAG: helix-turn-helix domain-containing protein, partial [Methylophilaceae bacterium]|nr:helix-turn-helix domain-containing protein [Methylophilaceae bacterium]